MVLDTSAIVAILLREREHDAFAALLADAEDPIISAATLLEASIVMQAKTGDDGVAALDELLAAASVRCAAVDHQQAITAREAYSRYGEGRSAAALNFGDCFVYALAHIQGRPLLFKETDFSRTGIEPADHAI